MPRSAELLESHASRIIGLALALTTLLPVVALSEEARWIWDPDEPPIRPAREHALRDIQSTSLSAPRDLQAGDYHVCLLRDDGTVSCAGDNRFGQLGDGSTSSREHFLPVKGLRSIEAISLGSIHSCALRDDGAVLCWGQNAFGQLGVETPCVRARPAPVDGLASFGSVRQIVAGGYHSCAVFEGGRVACWGGNLGGRPLDAATMDRAHPRLVPRIMNVSELTIGDAQICVSRRDGTVACFGRYITQCSRTDRAAEPPCLREMPQIAGATAVNPSSGFACALMPDRTAMCWGGNSYGQLAGARSGSIPNHVPTLRDVAQLSLGHNHGCALDVQGQVRCWGHNRFGRLGFAPSFVIRPAPLVGSGVVEQIALGRGFTCLRHADGRIRCLGDFSEGRQRGRASVAQASMSSPS